MVKALPRNDVSPELSRRVTDELLSSIERERTMLEPEAQPLLDELESIVSSGGKRLRPRFCYWGYRAAGGADGDEIIRVGAALELLHTMALIHDDVMDRSAVRRKRPSTFRVLAELSAGGEAEHRGDPQRFGASAAILTGMLGFVLADRLLASTAFPSERKAAATDRYDRMRARAIAGQYLDLLAAHRGEADEPTARRIAVLKSGSYSVADPLVVGALLASDDPKVADALESYGVPLGEAFQIRDDVIGMFGDPDVTGKERDGDIREGKQTVLLAKAKRLASGEQRRILDAHVGRGDVTTEDADAVRLVVDECGALDETERLVAELAGEAVAAIDTSVIEPEAARVLLQMATEATARRA